MNEIHFVERDLNINTKIQGAYKSECVQCKLQPVHGRGESTHTFARHVTEQLGPQLGRIVDTIEADEVGVQFHPFAYQTAAQVDLEPLGRHEHSGVNQRVRRLGFDRYWNIPHHRTALVTAVCR